MVEKVKCLVCGTENIDSQYSFDRGCTFFVCPSCGRYELTESDILTKKYYIDGLDSFFFYNGFRYEKSFDEPVEYRYFTPRSKEYCDEYNKKADEQGPYHGRPVHYDVDIINTWMPKSLSEKVDSILIKINELSDYIGKTIFFTKQELYSCLFVKRRKSKSLFFSENETDDQMRFMLDYLTDCKYISYVNANDNSRVGYNITIISKGYERIDELEKKNADGKIVLVAMKFGEDTMLLREAIRDGISQAGYSATFIDEVEHNEFITPELLSYIRRSRFVVADLTHQNNGAYFEEGYAMGIGKPVIQLCKKDVKLHFDIAQKNTIIWESEEEIPNRLYNRIKATIG